MSCHKYQKMTALHVAGDLPEAKVPRLEEHLGGCPACRSLAEELRASQSALEALRGEPVEEAALEQVRQRVLARLAAEGQPRRHFGWAYALAAGLAVVVAVWSVSHRPAPEVPQRAVVAAPREARPGPVAKNKTGVLPHRAPRVKRPAPAAEPLLVKLITDDPEVIIYWLIEKKGG
jgi:anti-sigma factor RsiW